MYLVTGHDLAPTSRENNVVFGSGDSNIITYSISLRSFATKNGAAVLLLTSSTDTSGAISVSVNPPLARSTRNTHYKEVSSYTWVANFRASEAVMYVPDP